MPDLADHHKGIPNPYIEEPRRIDEYTAQEIATLQSRLDKKLGPEYLSTRPGAGGARLHYVTSDKIINLANEVFGFNGWSSAIQQVQVDFCDENTSSGRINLGLSVICRVTLKDGTYHEDIGYGQIENSKSKAAAFEKAKKEGATDALKRALRNFGNVLGNCVYDHDYLQKITKVKAPPIKFDENQLHRHAGYAQKRTPPSEGSSEPLPKGQPTELQKHITLGSDYDDDFGGALFDAVELDPEKTDDTLMSDKAAVDGGVVPQRSDQPQPRPQMSNNRHSMPGNMPSMTTPHRPTNQAPQSRQSGGIVQQGQNNQIGRGADPYNKPDGRMTRPAGAQNQGQSRPVAAGHTETKPNATANQYQPIAPAPGKIEGPALFVTGRSAEALQNQGSDGALPVNATAFNPHLESPSLRRTNGVNHSRSVPIARTSLGTAGNAPLNQQPIAPNTNVQGPIQAQQHQQHQHQQLAPRPNIVNPQLDANRRIGMPAAAAASPLANRGGYRPPAMAQQKRTFDGGTAAMAATAAVTPGAALMPAVTRQPLADLSNVPAPERVSDGVDVKRQRVMN